MNKPILIITIILLGIVQISCNSSKNERRQNGLISYYSDQNGEYNIFVMKSDRTRQHKLTTDKTKNTC